LLAASAAITPVMAATTVRAQDEPPFGDEASVACTEAV